MQKGFLALFIWLTFFSCNPGGKKQDAISVFKNPIKNRFSSYYKLYSEEEFTALVTYLNLEKNDSVVYILYKNKKPTVSFKAYYVKTPVSSVACLASVFVGSLENLNLLKHIIAIDNADYIYNNLISKKCANNEIKQLAKTGLLNIEQTLVCKPEIIFTNPGGDLKKDFDPRLLQAGIIPVVCADYFETSPLARAEWVKALALFFNEEKRADSLFSAVEKKYIELKQLVDTCQNKPSVFTELKTNDVWYVAGGKSNMAQLFYDAGAKYVFDDNNQTNALSLNMEQVISKASGADYWINLHYSNSAEDIIKQDKRYAVFNAYQKRNLYNNNALMTPAGANAYWEQGLNHPDELLSDLIRIFHPGLLPRYTLKYYKQLK